MALRRKLKIRGNRTKSIQYNTIILFFFAPICLFPPGKRQRGGNPRCKYTDQRGTEQMQRLDVFCSYMFISSRYFEDTMNQESRNYESGVKKL
jgi:hypothetical protein